MKKHVGECPKCGAINNENQLVGMSSEPNYIHVDFQCWYCKIRFHIFEDRSKWLKRNTK